MFRIIKYIYGFVIGVLSFFLHAYLEKSLGWTKWAALGAVIAVAVLVGVVIGVIGMKWKQRREMPTEKK